MQNRSLVADYLTRAGHRLAAIDVLYERASWADVVRESQEVVELTLKALLRHAGIEVPRVHDVGNLLEEHRDLLPAPLEGDVERLAEISRRLRRDRELAFYGSEDLTPSEFYREADAKAARAQAQDVVHTVTRAISFLAPFCANDAPPDAPLRRNAASEPAGTPRQERKRSKRRRTLAPRR